MSVFDQIKQIIQDQKSVDSRLIKLESNLVEDFGFDSLGIVEFTLAVGEHFGIDIPDEEKEKFRTVQDAVSYVTCHSNVH